MMGLMNKLLALSVAALLAAPSRANEWVPLGARSVGMGGAGVALPHGPLSAYWNPGALGAPSPNGGAVAVTAHGAFTGDVFAGSNELRDLANNPGLQNQADIDAAFRKFDQPGNGFRFNVGASILTLKLKYFTAFVNSLGTLGAVPRADRVNTTAATIENNQSRLILKGANVAEFGLGAGHEIPYLTGVYAGGALKLLRGQVGYAEHNVIRDEVNGDQMARKLKEGSAHSSNLGVDAGVLWDVKRTFEDIWLHPRIGFTGRNLNNPKFKQPESATRAGVTDRYALNPQYRLGASLSPFSWWNVAADLDMSRNLTSVDNVASRQFALGTEFNIVNTRKLNVPIRLGLQKNLADRGSKTQLSFGSGLTLFHTTLDGSIMWSPKKVDGGAYFDRDDVPSELSVGLGLSVLFGGASDDGEHARARSRREAREEQPAPSSRVREASEKAQQELDTESQRQYSR